MKDSKKIVRRRHSGELNAQVLSECAQPVASVPGVALSHGINANFAQQADPTDATAPCAGANESRHTDAIGGRRDERRASSIRRAVEP